jgi:hypothetical protein
MMLSLSRSIFFIFAKKKMKLGHPHCLPDLVVCKFWLFPKLNTMLKGHRLLDAVEIQGHVATILKSIAGEGCLQYFEHWKY